MGTQFRIIIIIYLNNIYNKINNEINNKQWFLTLIYSDLQRHWSLFVNHTRSVEESQMILMILFIMTQNGKNVSKRRMDIPNWKILSKKLLDLHTKQLRRKRMITTNLTLILLRPFQMKSLI